MSKDYPATIFKTRWTSPDAYKHIKTVGVGHGGVLFVHSSIKAIGADVRAEELIAALRQAVGEKGTLVFPTFTSRQEDYFNPDKTPSVLGVVTEVFRSMPDTLRLLVGPWHPVGRTCRDGFGMLPGGLN
jgi:aminoglycoside N3'-acetyltransferase